MNIKQNPMVFVNYSIEYICPTFMTFQDLPTSRDLRENMTKIASSHARQASCLHVPDVINKLSY